MHEQIGCPAGQGDRFDLGSSCVVRNAGLDQMAVAIQLVLDLQVDPSHAREMDLVIGKQVTIRCLGMQEKSEKGSHTGAQFGVWMKSVHPRSRIQPLISIRVGEEPALAEAVLIPSGDAEVVDAPAGLQLLPLVKDRPLGIGLLTW